MILCVNSYVVQSTTVENTDTVMTNNLCISASDTTYKERISVFYCLTVHFNSLNLTYQLMHFYIQ